jgi:hypothetical protein
VPAKAWHFLSSALAAHAELKNYPTLSQAHRAGHAGSYRPLKTSSADPVVLVPNKPLWRRGNADYRVRAIGEGVALRPAHLAQEGDVGGYGVAHLRIFLVGEVEFGAGFADDFAQLGVVNVRDFGEQVVLYLEVEAAH